VYDFDQVIDRRGTYSLKYDFARERGMPYDALPLWVADMDLPCPQPVRDALRRYSEMGIFGYSAPKYPYYEAVMEWFANYHDWGTEEKWIVRTPGVVFAIAQCIRALTKEGDSVLIQPPVYYPFRQLILKNGRKLVMNQLEETANGYRVDIMDFYRKVEDENVKLFILCSPHNPVGRVWQRGELQEMDEVCRRCGVTVVSDEIHSDFVMSYPDRYGNPVQHTVYAKVSDYARENSVICTSPSKTFNLAGLQISNLFIPNEDLRNKVKAEIARSGYDESGLMGLVACETAYREGVYWLGELRRHLYRNLQFVRRFLETEMPQVKLVEPQGTYLLWLDFRSLGLDDAQKAKLVNEEAKVWLDAGSMFGPGGEGFERINIACPRQTLEEALTRIRDAIKRRGL
jgi:cystathionine beta-lyase